MDNKEFLDYIGLQHYTEKVQTFVNTKIENASSNIVLKHDTEANWKSDKNKDFRPLDGEFIIYDPDETHPYLRYKRGRPSLVINTETGESEVQKDENDNIVMMLLSDLPFESNINIYIGDTPPADAPAGFLWLDTKDTPDIVNFASVEGVRF